MSTSDHLRAPCYNASSPCGIFVRVPGLGTVPTAAASALQVPGENVYAALGTLVRTATHHFQLDFLEYLRVNDCLVVVLNVVLRNFAFVYLLLLGEKVHREVILQGASPLYFSLVRIISSIFTVVILRTTTASSGTTTR